MGWWGCEFKGSGSFMGRGGQCHQASGPQDGQCRASSLSHCKAQIPREREREQSPPWYPAVPSEALSPCGLSPHLPEAKLIWCPGGHRGTQMHGMPCVGRPVLRLPSPSLVTQRSSGCQASLGSWAQGRAGALPRGAGSCQQVSGQSKASGCLGYHGDIYLVLPLTGKEQGFDTRSRCSAHQILVPEQQMLRGLAPEGGGLPTSPKSQPGHAEPHSPMVPSHSRLSLRSPSKD